VCVNFIVRDIGTESRVIVALIVLEQLS